MNEAELLFTEVLQCDRPSLYRDSRRALTPTQSSFIASALRRRMRGEPIQYILGEADFMGLEFKVTPDCLIPRPETEILVEALVQCVDARTRKGTGVITVLDVGTGSGCIAVSLARSRPEALVTATDISARAIEVARKNALRHGVAVSLVEGDLFAGVEGRKFDIIVSNPPYVSSGEIDTLQREIRYEPRVALDGGADGVSFYRRMIDRAPRYLAGGGAMLMEIGSGQRRAIEALIEQSGTLRITEIKRDYSGIERVVGVVGSG